MDHALLERLMQRLHAEFGTDLVGVLAGGSRLRGEGDANSDVDFVVIIEPPRRRRWNILLEGIEIEMFVNPPFQMRRYFESERDSGRGQMPHLFSTGTIIFDPKGIMAELQSEARAIWEAGPPPISGHDRWHFRYMAADMLRDITDVASRDEGAAAMLIAVLLSQLVDQHYRISGRWLHKRKRVLNDLAKWDPTAARFARLACDGTQTIVARHEAVHSLAERVLSPLGGLMPLEWGTDWEEVKP